MILLHGRGQRRRYPLLADELDCDQLHAIWLPGQPTRPEPSATHSWLPIEQNESPWLTSALESIEDLFTQLEARGLAPERVGLLGFSQGACLALNTQRAARGLMEGSSLSLAD